MPSAATLTAAAGFPLPAVYATQAGTVTVVITRKAGAVLAVSDQAAVKTGVS